jgi:PAS domain S-box-containing protein
MQTETRAPENWPGNLGELDVSRILQDAFRESERQYHALLEGLGVAVYTTDAEGRITFYNEAAAQMWGRHPAIGVDLWCGSWRIYTVDGEPLPHDQCPMAVTLKEGRPVRDVEAIAERPDGTRFRFMPFPSPLRDASGRLVGAVNVLVDVTEQRRAQAEAAEAIRQSMEIKDQFLGLISHELRTPIATILGNALLLLRRGEALPADDRQQALMDVAGEADKLQRIIENLLLMTRVEIGENIECEPVSLPALTAQAVADFQQRRPNRAVLVKADREVPPAWGHAPMIGIALENLLSNADKYSAVEKPIEVQIRSIDEGVEVAVKDYGIGIDPAVADDLFTPFYRSKEARSRAKGLGLGLAVCKRVIEAQGGSVSAARRPEGGSEFWFTLKGAQPS